jgi:hypothetical protein
MHTGADGHQQLPCFRELIPYPTSKMQQQKKIDTVNHIQIKYFCLASSTFKETKNNPKNRKYWQIITNKGLVSRSSLYFKYKELLYFNNKKINRPIEISKTLE